MPSRSQVVTETKSGREAGATRDEQLSQERLAALASDLGAALTQSDTVISMLGHCAETVVLHFNAAFARIWTLTREMNVLELQASAGLYTHLDGAHSRIPVGLLKIGHIAAERRPHLTNSVIGDPRVPEQDWARREGMVAFAGYPLIVGDQLVGVMAMFTRNPLSPSTLTAMAAVSHGIALGILRMESEASLRDAKEALEERVRQRTAELSETNAELIREADERRRAEQKLGHTE